MLVAKIEKQRLEFVLAHARSAVPVIRVRKVVLDVYVLVRVSMVLSYLAGSDCYQINQ